MAFPAMIKMRRKKAVEVIGETFFEFLTPHCRLGHRFLENTSLKFSRRRRHRSHSTSLDRAADRRQSFMAHGAPHSVFRHEPISFRTDYALNVIGQKIFEIHTKHRFSLPAAFSFFALVSPCLPANS